MGDHRGTIVFLAKRVALLLLTLLIASFVIFSSLFVAPGSPIATLSGGRSLSPETVAALTREYHLNDPFLVRYWDWVTAALHGDLGQSIAYRNQPVSSFVTAGAATTLGLVAYASVLILIVGIGLGLLAGLREGPLDAGVVGATTVGAAVPGFIAAVILITVFAVNLGWFPAEGEGAGLFDSVRHLTLPAIALAVSSMALLARVTRTSVRGELGREHVQTAVSRGIPYPLIVRKHVVRNAAIPITTAAGLTIASLIVGAAIIERAFALNGLGNYLINAVSGKDFAVVQGISLVLVVAFVVTNVIIDILYALLDPRVKLGTRAE